MAGDPDFRIKLGDKVYTLRVGDITGQIALECRKETGFPPMAFLRDIDGFDADSAGVMIWICRRLAGERVKLGDVMREVNLDVLMTAIEDSEVESPDPRPSNDETVTAEQVAANPEG